MDFESVLSLISTHFKDNRITVNGTVSNTPCYEIEIELESEKKSEYITIYISMFIPFYHVIHLSNSKEGKVIYSYEISERLNLAIKTIINENLGFMKFPNELLECPIPELDVLSDFNYRCAFFTDFYKITYGALKT